MREKRDFLPAVFFCTQGMIYTLFLYLDISGRGGFLSPAVKFLGILLCAFFTAAGLRFGPGRANPDALLVLAALVFTAAADICLLLADYYALGVCFFIAVQLFYLERLRRHGIVQNKYRAAFFRLLLAALVLGLLSAAGLEADLLLAVTVFYFLNIFFNTIHALRWAAKGGSLFFAAGMALFLLCDINVGIYNMGAYLPGVSAFLKGLVSFSSIAMWLFYLPAQVLIARSAYGGKRA